MMVFNTDDKNSTGLVQLINKKGKMTFNVCKLEQLWCEWF